jgi:23S rRNA pseudouridine2605 synthase
VPPEGEPAEEHEAGEGERLQKLLARAGLGSRRTCEALIAAGRVTVDDRLAILGTRADPARSRIALDGVPVVADTTRVYWLLNKPAGYVTTARDPQGRRTVMELVPSEPRTFSVGRLDLDTEGLLLMTNDGELAELLTHPRHGVEKAYLAEVEGIPSPAAMRAMREGLELDDGLAKAVRAQVVQRSNDGDAALEIVMNEGRKRIVRRMCAEIGHPVRRLVRTRIGQLTDPKLPPGSHRPLTSTEVRGLYTAALVGHEGAGGPGARARGRGA